MSAAKRKAAARRIKQRYPTPKVTKQQAEAQQALGKRGAKR